MKSNGKSHSDQVLPNFLSKISQKMSSITTITAQTSGGLTPTRNLGRETALNLNNKNLNGRASNSSRQSVNPSSIAQRTSGQVMTVRSHQKIRVTVLCARSLAKRDLFRLPDPFVRVNVDGSGQSHATESCKNTLDPKWNVYYDLLLSSEDSITISVWNDKKIHTKKDGIVKLNNSAAFLGCVKLLSNAIQRLKDTGICSVMVLLY